MASVELTARQRQVLEFVQLCCDDGVPPTLREIGDYLGIRSTNGVNDHLMALERKGYIERQRLKSRAIRVTRRIAAKEEEPGK